MINTTQQTYQHWRLETDAEKILWLTLDRKNASVNTLNQEVFIELEQIINQIHQEMPAGVIILSGKAKGFIAGADISQFTHLNTKEEAYQLIKQAQNILDKLAALSIPTVAMIKGFCLGGGLELALACRYRIAENSSITNLGLPEVMLGLHPGWGGTVRLPLLIGAPAAMKMMLTGIPVNAKKAGQLGLVDEVVPERQLRVAARYYIMNKPAKHAPKGFASWSNFHYVRPLLGKLFYKQLAAKVNKKHYPAPFAIIRNWLRDGATSPQAMDNEAKSISELMMTETCQNLVRVFFLQEKLKGFAKKSKFKPQWVHVIGAGTMGGDIAAWCAYKGMRVTLQDQTDLQIAPAIKKAYKLFKEKLKEPRLVQAAFDRLQPDPKGLGIKHADVIIEAIFENLSVKQNLFAEIEPQIKPEALLATNTSSFPLQEIATILKDPTRLIGLHFFNPVAKMKLVEIVNSSETDPQILENAASFINKIGHLSLPVKSSPGFLVNRILVPYLLEAMQLFEEGFPIVMIDQAAKDFGMPMGPIELADKVGLDICLAVGENLAQYYNWPISPRLKEMVQQKQLGIKTDQGFYQYKYGRLIQPEQQELKKDHQDIIDRLILRLINECIACLDEGVVAEQDLADAGMIFGTGFAPFRGGPIQYTINNGAADLYQKLLILQKVYGERFKPHAGWQKLISSPLAITKESAILIANPKSYANAEDRIN